MASALFAMVGIACSKAHKTFKKRRSAKREAEADAEIAQRQAEREARRQLRRAERISIASGKSEGLPSYNDAVWENRHSIHNGGILPESQGGPTKTSLGGTLAERRGSASTAGIEGGSSVDTQRANEEAQQSRGHASVLTPCSQVERRDMAVF